jgi:hypothetical protein
MASREDWGTETIGYSEYNFYTNAVDKKGHGTVAHTKYPDYMLAVVSEIVQSKEIPQYRTQGDVMRDALFHRLVWLDKNKGNVRNIPNLSRLVQIMISKEIALNRAREAKELNDLVKQVKETCEMLYNFADYSELKETIEEQRERLKEAEIRDPYRKRIVEILDEYERKLPKGESA